MQRLHALLRRRQMLCASLALPARCLFTILTIYCSCLCVAAACACACQPTLQDNDMADAQAFSAPHSSQGCT